MINFKILDLTRSAYIPNAPCEGAWDGIGTAAVAAGASLLGNAWNNNQNYHYQMDANQANAVMQQAQLDWQEKMYYKNRDFQVHYNNPKYQYQMLKDAGLNPILDKYGIGNGSTTAVNTQPPTGVTPPYIQPYRTNLGLGITESVASVLQLAMQNNRNNADIASMRAKTANETLETAAKIGNLDQNNKYVRALTDEVKRNYEFEEYNLDARTKGLQLQNYLMTMQAKSIVNDMLVKDIQTKIQSYLASVQASLAASNIEVNRKNMQVSDMQIKQISQNIANQMIDGRIKSAEAAMKEFENQIKFDPNNPDNVRRERWFSPGSRDFKAGMDAFKEVLDDINPLKGVINIKP